jgi:hypothetical protein
MQLPLAAAAAAGSGYASIMHEQQAAGTWSSQLVGQAPAHKGVGESIPYGGEDAKVGTTINACTTTQPPQWGLLQTMQRHADDMYRAAVREPSDSIGWRLVKQAL